MTYFEELMVRPEGGTPKCLGVRAVTEEERAGRTLGHGGRRDVVMTEPFTLLKGCNERVYKASASRPVVGVTMLWPCEGRERL